MGSKHQPFASKRFQNNRSKFGCVEADYSPDIPNKLRQMYRHEFVDVQNLSVCGSWIQEHV